MKIIWMTPKRKREAAELGMQRTNQNLRAAHAQHMAFSTGHPAGRALRERAEEKNIDSTGSDWN